MIGTIITASAATLVAVPAAGLFGYRGLKRARLARRLRITTPNGINESGFVRIGGIDQWISIRGDDRANPVLLEVHGGPGSSNLPFTHRTRAWERHFTIVRWDMRGAGKTFANGGAAAQGAMSLDRVYDDAVEVTEHVRARLGVDKVVLVANSFGSVTGLRLARNRPDLYSAYVGTDQNIIGGGRPHPAHAGTLERLRRKGKRKDLEFVEAMGPDATGWDAPQFAKFSQLTAVSDPLTYDTMKTVVIRSLWFSPLHRVLDIPGHIKAMGFSEQIGPSAMGIDEFAEGTEFQVPLFIFQGDSDVITPVAPARRFYEAVTAPHKDFALIEDASHFASFRHPDRFLELLLTKVRPVLGAAATGR